MIELNKIITSISGGEKKQNKNNSYSSLFFVNKSTNPDPNFDNEGDSGFDLRADIDNNVEYHIEPGKIVMVNTGLYFEIEKGFEIQIRPRSDLARDYGVTIVNSPYTINSHDRDEIIIILVNLGEKTIIIRNGDRIAQGVVCPVYGEGNLNIIKVEKLSETSRNYNEFNSSIIK
jgi:dUTP pyrophosphatase